MFVISYDRNDGEPPKAVATRRTFETASLRMAELAEERARTLKCRGLLDASEECDTVYLGRFGFFYLSETTDTGEPA